MIDLKFLRENPEVVKENIRKKFQDEKLPLVDEVIELDAQSRTAQKEADDLRANRNKISKEIGKLMGQGKKEEAMAMKEQVNADAKRLSELEAQEEELQARILKIMMTIPNIIDPSVPIGKNDTENVEVQRYGEPVVPDFEIPYHTEIMESFCDTCCNEDSPDIRPNSTPHNRPATAATGVATHPQETPPDRRGFPGTRKRLFSSFRSRAAACETCSSKCFINLQFLS